MKEVLIALCAILAVSTAKVVISVGAPHSHHLLGVEECTWGPSYWCENIKTAAGCNATKHCIKAIWEKIEVPEDKDSVCTICKKMVQQARDQLESNQTMEDLKAVFDGSCMLMHIKPVVKECITLVDEYIPDLVETLASQMNPSVVCSVAGLCNSARIDKFLLEQEMSKPKISEMKSHSLENDELEPDECSKCYTIAAHMEHKLNNTSRDKILKEMLNVCAELGSFSDACSATILTYFKTIYAHLQENFKAQNICHLSGQCSAKFHKHEDGSDKIPNVEITPLSSVGMVEVGDDLPCKLCEQLVGHLRDLLVANTTEAEFQKVLEGLCKQTKSFSTECTAIVDEYYPQIYNYLTKGLNTNLVCEMSGICPGPDKVSQDQPIWPLLPPKASEIGVRILKEPLKNVKAEKNEQLSSSELEAMQLPVERLLPFPGLQLQTDVRGKESCALCEYVLHYLQHSLTDPKNEEKLKQSLAAVCNKLPKSLKGECKEFIDTYGDAVIAILVQEIDPSQVCPMLHLCPSAQLMELLRNVPKESVLEEEVQGKPNCPLCLLAVGQLYNVIKNNKTEANIEAQLDKLCTHLPSSLTDECKDLVKGYSKELVELLIADLTPQEVCVFIKLCDENKYTGPTNIFKTNKDGEIMTNEIPDLPHHPKGANIGGSPTCVVCEFAMEHIDKVISNKKTKDEIERAVRGVCNHLPRTISKECNDFVDEYADVLIDILSKDVTPKEVCSMMGLCKIGIKQLEVTIGECALCRMIVSTLDKILSNPKVDTEIEEAVAVVCKFIPSSKRNKCEKMIEVYGQSIINILKNGVTPREICGTIALCAPDNHLTLSLQGSRIRRSYGREQRRIHGCTWGKAYWCQTDETARECGAIEYCKEHVWKGDVAPSK